MNKRGGNKYAHSSTLSFEVMGVLTYVSFVLTFENGLKSVAQQAGVNLLQIIPTLSLKNRLSVLT